MKVTTKMFYDSFLSGIQKNLEAVINDNEQISTQKKINRPSDDPTAMSRIVNYKTELSSIDEYKKAISAAKSPLEAFDSAFTNLSDIMTRSSELAIGGASNLDANSRLMIAKEVSTLFDGTVGIANTKLGDRYLFSGFKSSTAPVDTSTNEFVSDTNPFEISIRSGSKIGLNISAGDLFSFKRVNSTDPTSGILPQSTSWSNNGANTIPGADPISALLTSSNGFTASSDVMTLNGGSLTIKVEDGSEPSSGGFVINNTNHDIKTNLGAAVSLTDGIYTGAALADALSASGTGIKVTFDNNSRKFSITSTGAANVDWSAANNIGSILGFTSGAVQIIGSGISSDKSVGDVNLAANSTLEDVRNAINKSNARVQAEVVNVGTTANRDFKLVISSSPVGKSDKIVINSTTSDVAGSGLNLLSYDPEGTMSMVIGTDIVNYNYITESSANDSIVINNGVNDSIKIKEGAFATATAVIDQGTYTSTQLASKIQDALNAVSTTNGSGNAYTVLYDQTDKKFTITNTTGATTVDLLWNDTGTTARQLLGFAAVKTSMPAVAASTDKSDNPVLANYYSFNNNYLNESYALRAMNFLKVSLESNDVGRISKSINYINKVAEKVSQSTAEVGARLNNLDTEDKYHDDRAMNINSYLSNDQDADIGKVYTDMAQRQNSLQALRIVSTDFLNTNLFDFLK